MSFKIGEKVRIDPSFPIADLHRWLGTDWDAENVGEGVIDRIYGSMQGIMGATLYTVKWTQLQRSWNMKPNMLIRAGARHPLTTFFRDSA